MTINVIWDSTLWGPVDIGNISQIGAVVVSSATLISTYFFVYWKQKKKKTLLYSILTNANTAKWLGEKFQIRHLTELGESIEIENPHILVLRVKNICKSEVGKSDFASQIMLELPPKARIIGQPKIDSSKEINSVTRNITSRILEEGKKMEILFDVLSPQHFFSIAVITNGNPEGFDFNAYGKEKQVSFKMSNFNKTSWRLILLLLCSQCALAMASILAFFYYSMVAEICLSAFISFILTAVFTYVILRIYGHLTEYVNQ